MPSQPTLATLAAPPSAADIQRQQQQDPEYEDCTPCRLMGSAAFTGLGIYTFHSGMKQLRERSVQTAILRSGSRFGLGARKAGIVGMSAVLVGMGWYRLRR